ncbi:MAG: hypothetical protein ABIJ61_11940 [bacterium]
MDNLDDLILEFDDELRVLHFSAKTRLDVKSKEDLNALCQRVGAVLEYVRDEGRCFLLVDMSKIAIDPILNCLYAEKVEQMTGTFLFEEGIFRYGYEITRVTASMAQSEHGLGDPHFFSTKEAALTHIRQLVQTAAIRSD